MDSELRKILKEPDIDVPASGSGTDAAVQVPNVPGSKTGKLDRLSGSSGPLESLKKVYFFFEDRYYALLDKINKVVPVYKVVDPIDKAVPSFPLLIGLIALVIIFFMMFSFAPSPMVATLHVVDNKNDSLEGVVIELSFENQKKELLTNKWGEATLEMSSPEAKATASLSKGGFEDLEREVTLAVDETTSLTMQPVKAISFDPADAEKTVKVIDDSTNRLLAKEVTLTFQCQPQGSSPPPQTGRTGEFQITHPRNCGTLSATAEADGYRRKSKTLSSKVNYINLTPNITKTTGDISVTVKDSDRNPEADVVVRAIDEATSLEEANSLTGLAGNALLKDLKPGTYTVSVITTDGRTGQETGVSVTAGQTTPVRITLPAIDEVNSRKIFLKMVEKGTQDAIENAQVFIYDGNTLVDSTASNAQGIVEKKLAEPKPSYLLVFTHPEFVTTIEPSISPKELSATEPITVLMARSTTDQPNPTSAEVTATVVDEALVPVENALVTVYSSLFPDIPLKTPPGKTLNDGTYTFSNLAPGDYVLKARGENGGAEGKSAEFTLDAGQSLGVQLMLVLGEGTVQVKVFDLESALKDPVPNAEVNFIDAADGTKILASCTTDTTGQCESEPIAADRFVYVSASAQGFLLKYAASTVDVVNKNRANVEIGLVYESSIPVTPGNIDTRFRLFCSDVDCKSPANKIESDPAGTRTYYALFELVVSDDGPYSNPLQHIRIGPDSEIQLPLPNDYKAKIRGISGPVFSHAILSTCWNNDSVDPFTDQDTCATGRDAKQANVYYPDLLGKQIIPVVVEFVVEQGLADGTQLEFHFKAKATSASQEIVTQEKVKRFLVNEVLCDQQDFSWSFSLEDGQGQTTILGTDPNTPNVVTLNQPYNLSYTVYNCSGRGYSNASITAENKPLTLEVISFTQTEPFDYGPANAYSQASFSFPADVEISHTLPIFIASEAQLSELELRLDAGLNPSIELIPFSVSSQNLLKLEHQPSRLSPNGSPNLTGKVTDNSSGTPLENVLVSLKISDGVIMTTTTDSAGLFSINGIAGLGAVASVTLSLRKAGYQTLSKQIDVGNAPPLPDPSLDCITVERQGQANTDIFFDFDISGTAIPSDSFSITNNCQEEVTVLLESELEFSTLQAFPVDVGDTKQVRVNAATWANSNYGIAIGEYGIGVKAMYASDDPLSGFRGPIYTVRVYVTDPTSCFRLADPAEPSNPNKTKTSFDIKAGLTDGMIVNDCFVFFEDLRLPFVKKVAGFSPVEEAYSLVYNSPTQPAQSLIKKKVFDPSSDNFGRAGSLTFNVTDSGGYVFVDWVDFFMTDKTHIGGDRHQALAQTYDGVWSNISAQLPFTGSQSSPLIDNLGWVDTETYYAQGALFDDELTNAPIWQGQHNVCNKNFGAFDDPFIPCSVPGYFRGVPLTSYNVGMIANKLGLRIEQNVGTEISGLRWQYTSTDKSHSGIIDFKVRNHTLMGETYALVEVEDSVGRYFIPGQGAKAGGDIDVEWVLSKRGTHMIRNPSLLLNQQITLRPGQILGLTVDEMAQTKFTIASSLAQVYARLGEPLNAKELDSLTFTADDFSAPFLFEDGERISTHLYLGGSWSLREDFDLEDPSQPHILPFTQSTSAKLIAYENNSQRDVVVNRVDLAWLSRDMTQVELARGISTISLGDSSVSFTPPQSNNDLPPANYDSIEYVIEDNTPEAIVYFSDTGESTSPNPYAGGTRIVAIVSSPEEGAATQKERFHIRLVGEDQSQCLGYNGVSGSTGPGSKPRVLFDWDWDAIDTNSCDSDNLNFIYCDPTQFTISLIQRLEKIRLLAEEFYAGNDPENDNILQARALQTSTAYLIEDAYVKDFRDDFVSFFGGQLLAYDLMAPDHPWGYYLLSDGNLVFDTTQASFSSDTQASPSEKLVAAGLHEVFIDLQFDRDQFDFFYTQGTGDTAVVDLRAKITVYITKLSDPVIKSPFYYLPFNGDVGLENGILQREGYGLVFDNGTGPIAVVSDSVGGTFYNTDSPQGSIGRKFVGTVRESSFDSANFINRGRVMDVAQDQSQIDFLPSIATPVLLEMVPQGSSAEAYYNIRDQAGGTLSSPASFMNLWTGAGSSMRDSAGSCIDFYGSRLEYRRQDSLPPSGSCAAGTAGSYGFNYDPASDTDKLYFETVFYAPEGKVITLRKSCDNASNFYAPGPSGGTQKTDNPNFPVSLSIQESKTKIATMQDVIDLVGQEYVCISSDNQSFSFWWNPQKVLSELDSVKTGINSDWEFGMKCEVGTV
jgi:hypothetical protein